jgi:murein DD-endopeptidase MepM/ murein hydrolase activator NlpD
LKTAANQIAFDLKEGKIKPEEAQKGLQDIERIAQAKARMKQNKAVNDSFLLNANYIQSQQAPAYKAETAIKAFKDLGLERGKIGQKINPEVTSAPNDNRKINGKKAPHKGYDLGATNETRIHSVNMKGTCIYAGFTPDFGNYVVIKYDNGTYMRAGHFSTSTRHLAGKIIPAGSYIANAGNTGFSTGTHLHVDFWDKNKQLISVEKFQRLMR